MVFLVEYRAARMLDKMNEQNNGNLIQSNPPPEMRRLPTREEMGSIIRMVKNKTKRMVLHHTSNRELMIQCVVSIAVNF